MGQVIIGMDPHKREGCHLSDRDLLNVVPLDDVRGRQALGSVCVTPPRR
jgi:hypothetical protein